MLTIDPKSAVGILEAFTREHPDFGRAATFFVLPAADPPNRLFNQPAWEGHKLQYLMSHGYEIGNHTLWHANLAKYPEATVRAQLAEAQAWIQRTEDEIREALRDSVMTIVETVRTCLEQTPPELAADIVFTGIVITGGGGLLRGLDRLLGTETQLPVTVAQDPMSCVALGVGRVLDELELLKKVAMPA